MNAIPVNHLGERRERALVLTNGSHVRQAAVNMLSSFGYRVDEADTRREAMEQFFTQRHETIVADAEFLPRLPRRMRRLFDAAHREPMVFIVVRQENVGELRQYLGQDPAYNLLNLPLDADEFTFAFGRAMHHHRQKTNYQFLRDVVFLLCGGIPVFVLLAVFIARGAG